MDVLRYPIGKFEKPEVITKEQREAWIEELKMLPEQLKQVVEHLSDAQLDTPYRPDGWTVRQVVHHLGDTHMNNFIRFKLALTEENPHVHVFDIDGWADLEDSKTGSIRLSLTLLDFLHQRWALLLETLTEQDFSRTFRHPRLGTQRLDEALGLYVWHGKHHMAHITSLRERMGWK